MSRKSPAGSMLLAGLSIIKKTIFPAHAWGRLSVSYSLRSLCPWIRTHNIPDDRRNRQCEKRNSDCNDRVDKFLFC